jgi:Ca2+-binding EF-hand superfamily protein
MYRILALRILLPVIILGLCSCTSGMKSRQEDASNQKTPNYNADTVSDQEKLTFKDYDTDNDSRISTDEYVAKQMKYYDQLDKNGNEGPDVEKFIIYWCSDSALKKGIMDPTLAPVYREMDKNNDGNITTQECRAYWMMKFNNADLDRNNRLSKQEYDSLMRDRFKSLLDGPNQDGYISNDDYNSFGPSVRP